MGLISRAVSANVYSWRRYSRAVDRERAQARRTRVPAPVHPPMTQGEAVVIGVILLVVCAVILGGVLCWTSSITSRNNEEGYYRCLSHASENRESAKDRCAGLWGFGENDRPWTL